MLRWRREQTPMLFHLVIAIGRAVEQRGALKELALLQ
jgi:hypothetical protein